MYDADGSFGQVRLVSLLSTQPADSGLFTLASAGWHRCNEQYRISRPQGCAHALLLLTVKGEGRLHVHGTRYTLGAGTLAVVPAGVSHTYFTPPGGWWEFYWLHPAGHMAQAFLKTALEGCPVCVSGSPLSEYAERLETLMTVCRDKKSGYALRVSQLVSELLHRAAAELAAGGQESARVSERVIAYLERHYDRPLRLEEAANALYLSTAYMIRQFRKETGRTPHAYLNEYRLLRAEQLLQFTDWPIGEIAAQTGFSSASHFIRLFHESRGVTPVAARAAQRA